MELKKLKEPFPACDVEWRIGSCGFKDNKHWAKALAYITARGIHNRLDEVCGEHLWQLRYMTHNNGTVCEIGIKAADEWIWKAGGADDTDFEAFKGGLSSAEKRAGVPWGIGRYLYKLPPTFVNCSIEKKSGWNYQGKNDKKGVPAFYWETPKLPAWALPDGEVEKEIPEIKPEPQAQSIIDKDGDISTPKPMIAQQKNAITNLLGKEGMDEVQIADFFETRKLTFEMAGDVIKRANVYAKEYLGGE